MSEIEKIKELIGAEIEIEESCIASEVLAGNVVKEHQYRGVKAGLEVALNIINAKGGAIESELSRLREECRMYHNLLALMCGDGGHYIDENGVEAAFNFAVEKYNKIRIENDRLREDVESEDICQNADVKWSVCDCKLGIGWHCNGKGTYETTGNLGMGSRHKCDKFLIKNRELSRLHIDLSIAMERIKVLISAIENYEKKIQNIRTELSDLIKRTKCDKVEFVASKVLKEALG